jgi:hypothetical protein
MPKSVRQPKFQVSESIIFVIKITYLSHSILLPFISSLGVVHDSFSFLFGIFRDLGVRPAICRSFLILGYLLSGNTKYPGCGFGALMTLGVLPRVR